MEKFFFISLYIIQRCYLDTVTCAVTSDVKFHNIFQKYSMKYFMKYLKNSRYFPALHSPV